MCHSFALCSLDDLHSVLHGLSQDNPIPIPEDLPTSGIVYPGMLSPVIISRDDANESETIPANPWLGIEPATFGWDVEWKKGSVFNARFDSLLKREGMWGDALLEGRCILPCATFFESHHSEMSRNPATGRLRKRRYGFRTPSGAPLLLGAVHQEGSFSVVTTEPNDSVEPIHDRMPLVLTAEEARMWLDPSTPLEIIERLADRSIIALEAETGEAAVPIPEQMRWDI